jgi:hypothetical protein
LNETDAIVGRLRQYYDHLAAGDFDSAATLFAEDAEVTTTDGVAYGPSQISHVLFLNFFGGLTMKTREVTPVQFFTRGPQRCVFVRWGLVPKHAWNYGRFEGEAVDHWCFREQQALYWAGLLPPALDMSRAQLAQDLFDGFEQKSATDPKFRTVIAQPKDPLERLERLAGLRESGALTDAEFAEQKAKLLGDP